jgi:thiamine biosynthesis lipoprotein
MVNRFACERAVQVSPDTFTLLQLALDVHEITRGAFDITAGSLSETWGFSRRLGRMPDDTQIADALARVGSNQIVLDEPEQAVQLLSPGMTINSGGIGKGFALDRAAAKLYADGIHDFMIHGGMSSVVAYGNRNHRDVERGWLVALRHPLRPDEILGTIRLENQALATSGSGKQFFHFGGQRYSHIIDPRSGWPAQGLMSVTVICPSGGLCDALATGMFVLGVDGSRELCRRFKDLAAILIFQQPDSNRIQLETLNVTERMWQSQLEPPHNPTQKNST